MATQGTFEHVRSPAVAGFFYPEDPGELRSTVEAYLADARQTNLEDPDTPWPKAVIAPHAGYVYSGPVAASVYARLEAARETVERVVLLGPSHRLHWPRRLQRRSLRHAPRSHTDRRTRHRPSRRVQTGSAHGRSPCSGA
ncbi:MAG: AmmeMemoRadiSam system protein B [Rhodospirillaceae bacterium]|nr:AmmeMemoRadiSam system protein B [Rhodospirillaceae bacterium]